MEIRVKQMDRKLHKAIDALVKMLKDEIPSRRITRIIEEGEVSELEIYEALQKSGYVWAGNKWQLYRPQWVKDAITQLNHDLQNDGLFDPFKPISEERDKSLEIFGDYLTSMEAFIESELKKRSFLDWEELGVAKNKPTVDEKPLTPYEQHLLDQAEDQFYTMWERDLEYAGGFPHILRNSFFVNLCAYLEATLVRQCSGQVGKNSIVKSAVKKLTGSLTLSSKIPEWEDILRFVDIRNYVVHNNSILDGSSPRDKRVRNYCGTKTNIMIKNNQIILEKGFCEDALKTVERFLRKIEIVSLDLPQIVTD